MKAVIYTRVSSTGERQNNERQISDLTDYAAYKKYNIVKVYEEKLTGAKKNHERPVLVDALSYCRDNHVDILLVSELSRLGRNAFEILEIIKTFVDARINLYLQKEHFMLLDDIGRPSLFAPVMLATLATCAELERDNIQFRLQSGYKNYREKGGKVGRKKGSKKTKEQLEKEYKSVLKELKRGTSIARTAKLYDTSTATVARLKKTFNI